MLSYLDFEKPIAELETRVAELRETANSTDLDIDAEVGRLETKANKLLRSGPRICWSCLPLATSSRRITPPL